MLLTVFSNHLLIDTAISLVPKLGLAFLFRDMTRDLCHGSSNVQVRFWHPSAPSSLLHGPGRVIVEGTRPSSTGAAAHLSRQRCESGLAVAQLLLLAVLVLWTVAQWGMGLAIRRYALKLEMAEEVQAAESGLVKRPGMDVEKKAAAAAFFREDSIADGYHDAVKAMQEWTWTGAARRNMSVAVFAVFSSSHKDTQS